MNSYDYNKALIFIDKQMQHISALTLSMAVAGIANGGNPDYVKLMKNYDVLCMQLINLSAQVTFD